MKPSWERWSLRNGCRINQQLRSSISMGILGFSLQICFKRIARRKVNLRVFMVLELIITIIKLRGIFKLLWIQPGNLWCMFHFIRQNVQLITFHCGDFILSMLFGFTIGCQNNSLVWHPLYYWQIQKLIIDIFFGLTSGDVQYMYWTQNYIITRRLQGVIFAPI